jgi:16S rRNA processing protein RimM
VNGAGVVNRAERWIPLAEIARPHGVHGEVRLKVFNADSDILLDLDEVLVRLSDGSEHEVSIDGARRADQAILLKLHSIDDRDRAEELRGAMICAKRASFPPLDDGEFYACDVEGAIVRAPGASGEVELGRVRELRSYPSVDALIVEAKDGGRDWEVPLVEAFVRAVDVERGVVELETMEGLER